MMEPLLVKASITIGKVVQIIKSANQEGDCQPPVKISFTSLVVGKVKTKLRLFCTNFLNVIALI